MDMIASLYLYQVFVLAFLNLTISHLFPKGLFFVFGQGFVQYSIGSLHISACKTRCNLAAGLHSHKSIVIPSVHIPRHPVSPLRNTHAPMLAFHLESLHLYNLNLSKRDGLWVSKGEEVALDDYVSWSDGDIFIFIENVVVIVSHLFFL